MRQNMTEVDIAAWKYVNLLSIREPLFSLLWFIFMESVSEVSGRHVLKATEKKKS